MEDFMWYDEAVFYQIYPLGFCDVLVGNDGSRTSETGANAKIRKVCEWIPHMKKLGITAIYFSPVFESDYHGYDTRDYTRIDCRLGSNADFADVVKELHANGIKVVLDGVFNHVGRGFWAFQDVLANREGSQYRDWFNINFGGNNDYNDGLWYEGWEGYYNLVKLNLRNGAVVDYLLNCVKGWVDEFDIDGIRLDVAYCLDHDFMRRLRGFTDGLKPEFFLLGEMLHGDYKTVVNDGMLHSATNYECYKGLYSSFNSMNMFEICHSLQRQFGKDNWCLYTGKHLLTFVDNHDVNRIASTLTNERHLPLIYGMAFGMPGIPCVYYGSEWGAKGTKNNGSDNELRQSYDRPVDNELSEFIGRMAKAHHESKALCYGDYTQMVLTNKQCIFARCADGEKVYVAINADGEEYTAHFDAGCGRAVDLITGEPHDFGGGSKLPPYSVAFWKCE
jgi:glycosidase